MILFPLKGYLALLIFQFAKLTIKFPIGGQSEIILSSRVLRQCIRQCQNFQGAGTYSFQPFRAFGPEIRRPTPPRRRTEIDIRVRKVREGRPSKNGDDARGNTGREREREGERNRARTADWENYYSLSRASPVVFIPSPPVGLRV